MKDWLQYAVLIISVASACFALISWYSASVQKRYASQRDFEHLKRNYQQLAEGQAAILKEIDSRFDQQVLDIRDVKNAVNGILLKVASDTSIGWGKRES